MLQCRHTIHVYTYIILYYAKMAAYAHSGISLSLSLSLSPFNGHFPGEPGLAGVY